MELLDTFKARKLAYYGHTMRKQEGCLEKEIMHGTMPGARRRGRPRTAWMDNIKTWTGLFVEESIRMTEVTDKCTKYVHGVANPRIEDGKETGENSGIMVSLRYSSYLPFSTVLILDMSLRQLTNPEKFSEIRR